MVRVDGKLERVSAGEAQRPAGVRGAIDFAGVEDQYFLVVAAAGGGPARRGAAVDASETAHADHAIAAGGCAVG